MYQHQFYLKPVKNYLEILLKKQEDRIHALKNLSGYNRLRWIQGEMTTSY